MALRCILAIWKLWETIPGTKKNMNRHQSCISNMPILSFLSTDWLKSGTKWHLDAILAIWKLWETIPGTKKHSSPHLSCLSKWTCSFLTGGVFITPKNRWFWFLAIIPSFLLITFLYFVSCIYIYIETTWCRKKLAVSCISQVIVNYVTFCYKVN